jgi:hypothetical protein
MPSLYVSPIELRARTILELVINYDEYSRSYTENVEPLEERWNDLCKDHSYSDLYELSALCNVVAYPGFSKWPGGALHLL